MLKPHLSSKSSLDQLLETKSATMKAQLSGFLLLV